MDLIIIIGIVMYCMMRNTPGKRYSQISHLLGDNVTPTTPPAPSKPPSPPLRNPTTPQPPNPFEKEIGTVLDQNAFWSLEKGR